MPDKNKPQRRALNLQSPWMMNTLRSLGISATNALADLMPATAGTVKTGARLATETAQTIRQARGSSRQVQNAIKNNQLVKTGQDFFKNAVNDLKSGNWHEERSSMSGMFDDLDTMFDDMDDMFGDDEGTEVNVNNVVSDSGASVKAIQKQTEYNVRAAQATVDTMVSLGSASLMKAEELGNKVINELTTINSTLNALLEYQNSNMTRFIEASVGYYEQMTAKVDDSYSSQQIKPENLYGDQGLDFSTYKDYVKQNIAALQNEGAISMVTMIMENLPDMLANPIDMVAKMGFQALIPKVTKEAMSRLDESMKNFIPYLLERIGTLGEGQTGMMGTALQYIGKVFGVKTEAKKDIDFSNIKTGPVPYNGKANHTIVEIIPKYLRESNNYLRVIAEHLTGQNAEALEASVTGFDWNTGRFKSIGTMKKEHEDDYFAQVLSGLHTSKFGKEFLERASEILSAQEAKDAEQLLNQIGMRLMERNTRVDFGRTGEIDSLMEGLVGTQNQKNFIKSFLQFQKDFSTALPGDLEATRINLKNRHNQYLSNLTSEENISNTNQLYNTGRDAKMDVVKTQMQKYRTISASDTPTVGPPPEAQSEQQIRQKLEQHRNDQNEVDRIINSGGGARQAAGRAAAKPFNAFSNILNSIMAGNADAAWDAFINGLGSVFSRAGSFVSEHFFNPIKESLFGSKDDNGYIHGGMLEGVNNRVKESFYSLRRMITGKGYKDAEGNEVPDATGDELKNTVVGKLRSSVEWMKDAIGVRLFGEKNADGTYKVDDEGNEKDGIIGSAKRGIAGATSSLLKGLTGWKHALFGKSEGEDEDEEAEGKKIFADLKKKAEEVAPQAIAGGIGGGLLGFMVGGPIGGALLGFAGGIASKSEKFMDWMFGKTDEETGERTGGVISKGVQDYFKKNGKFIAGGAMTGAISGAITGGGILGTIVGGPIAGALMGTASAVFLKSDMFQKMWFGDPERGQVGIKGHITRWTRSLGINAKTGDADGGKLAGMMGIGAIGGGLLGMMVGGPVLGALGGLSLSILAQKENFREWLFGKTDEKTGEHKEGVLGKFKNMLVTDIVRPLKTTASYIYHDVQDFFKFNIVQPAAIMVGALGDQVVGAFNYVKTTIGATLGDVGNFIKENFLNNIVEGLGKVFSPLVSATTMVAEGIYSAGKAVLSAPVKMITALMNPVFGMLGGAVKTVTSALATTVNFAIVKPLEYLVFKPLGAAAKLAGTVIAAPFKMIASAANWVNDHVVATIKHISRFFTEIGQDIKLRFQTFMKGVTDKIHEKIIEPVKNVVLAPIKAIGDVAKDMLHGVGTLLKRKISGFFSTALKFINPFEWIKSAVGLGKDAIGLLTGKKKDESQPKPERGGLFGYLGRMWNSTRADGSLPDRSNTLTADGTDSRLSVRDQLLNSMRDGKQMAEFRKKQLKEDRQHDKNAKAIRKATGGQRSDDTEESRRLAERMLGRKINWGGVDAEKTKEVQLQEESVDTEKQIKEKVDAIFKFLTGRGEKTPEQKADAAKASFDAGYAAQKSRATLSDTIEANRQIEGQAAHADFLRAKKAAKKVEDNTRRKRNEEIDQQIQDGATFGDLWSDAKNRLKGMFSFIKERNSDIPANADGTDNAEPGYSIVGERGPEVVYGKNAKSGRFVGLNGPEVIKMKGGETVIPNEKIDKTSGNNDATIADGLGGITAKTSQSDESLAKVSDTTKLSIGERLLNAVNQIKSAVIAKISGSGDAVEEPAEVDSVTGPTSDADVQEIMSGDGTNSVGAQIAPIASAGSENSSTDMVKDGQENSQLDQQKAQDMVSGKTGEVQRAAHAAIKAEEDKRNWMQKMLSHLKGTHEETEKHGISWDSIFSKKGLLTGALLAAIPLIWNWLRNFKLPDFLGTAGSVISNAFENIKDNIVAALREFFGLDNDDDESKDPVDVGVRTAGALIDAQVDRVTDLFNPFTAVYHNARDGAGNKIVNSVATRAKNNLLLWQPLKEGYSRAAAAQVRHGNMLDALKGANKYFSLDDLDNDIMWRQQEVLRENNALGLSPQRQQLLFDADEQLQNMNAQRQNLIDIDDDLTRSKAQSVTGATATIARNVGRVGVLTAGSNLAGGLAGNIAGMLGADEQMQQKVANYTTAGTAAVLTVDLIKSATTGNKGMIDKVLDMFFKMLQGLAKLLKADKTIAKMASKVDGLIASIYDATVGKVTQKIAEEICKRLGISASEQAIGMISMGIGIAVGAVDGLASGLCSVEHLFQVMPGDADALMTTISGLLQSAFHALEWTPVVGTAVAFIDVFDTIITSVFGKGLKQMIAHCLYGWLGGDPEYLETLQKKFAGELDWYNEEFGADLNMSAFNDMINNTSWWDKLWRGGAKVGEDGHIANLDDAGAVIDGGLKGLFVGGEKAYVKGADGKVIKDASGKAVVARDAKGNIIKKDEKWGDKVGQGWNDFVRFFAGGDTYETDENGQAIWDEETQSFKVAGHQDNVLKRAWAGMKDFGANALTTLNNMGEWLGNGLSDVGSKIAGTFGATIEAIKAGDVTAIWAKQEKSEDDNMFGTILSAYPNMVMKVIGTPIAAIVGAGRFIASPFVNIFKQVRAGIERASDEFEYGNELLKDPDSHLQDYFEIEDEDPENPLGGITRSIVIGSRLVSIPAAVLRKVGSIIGNFFTGVATAVRDNVVGASQNIANIDRFAIKGDPAGMWAYKIEENENSPVNGFTQATAIAAKVIATPVAGISWVGHRLADAAAAAGRTIATSVQNLGPNAHNVFNLALQGDPAGMWAYENQEDPNNPLQGVNNVIIGAMKVLGTPVAGISWVGHQVVQAVQGAWNTTRASIASLSENASTIFGLAVQGDPDGVWNVEINEDPLNPLNGVNNLLLGGLRIISMPIAGISWVGHQMVSGIQAMVASVQSGVQNLAAGNETLSKFAADGDPAGLIGSQMETDEGNPVGGVQGFIYNAMKIAHLPMASIRWMGTRISEWFTNATKDIGPNREALSKANEKISKLAADGDLQGIWNATLNLGENDPIRGIWSMAFGIGRLFNSAVAIFNSIIGPIQDTIEGVTKGFTDFTEGISNFTSNAGDNILGFFDGLFQDIKDFVKDTDSKGGSGSGTRGGRGTGTGGGFGSEPSMLNGMPYYSQNDSRWASMKYEKKYGESEGATMSNTGCGPTAMSMVINKMKGDSPTPPELARYAQDTGDRDNTGTNWNFIEHSANAYGIDTTRSVNPNPQFIANNLIQGNPMVLSGQSETTGPYTPAGHYIVATNIDSSGNISYNDPRGSSYSGRINVNEIARQTGAAWSFSNYAPYIPTGGYGFSSISESQNFDMKRWIRGGKGSGVMARDIVAVAENEVGYIGKASRSNLYDKTANPKPSGNPGYCKYAEETWPGKNNLHWCAMFVCWCMMKAANGNMDIAKQLMCGSGWSAGCDYIMNGFKAKGQLINGKTGMPLPGDLVLFNWKDGNNFSHAAHVGIVVGVNGDKVITIEGNTSSKGHTCGTCNKQERSRKNIIWFCRPIYDDTSNFQGVTADPSTFTGTYGITTTGVPMTTGTAVASTDNSLLGRWSTMLGQVATAGFNAAITGDTNIDWNTVFGASGGGFGDTGGNPLNKPFRVTSPFGTRTLAGKVEGHKGIDLVPNDGTGQADVGSRWNGTITHVNKNIPNSHTGLGVSSNTGGNMVWIKTDEGYTIKHMHLKHGTIPDSIQEGARITVGQKIGEMGTTGRSTGPHLHYQMEDTGGTPFDPSSSINGGSPITEFTNGGVTSTTDGATMGTLASGTMAGMTDKLSSWSSMMGQLATAGFNAALTGDMNIDWNQVFSQDTSLFGISAGTTSGGVVDPGDINERTQKVVQYFRSKGLNDAQIAGILGCWKCESGVTPGKVEGYYLKGYPEGLNYARDRAAVDQFTTGVLFPAYARSGIGIKKSAYLGQDGHYYPGVGLAQWTGPRGQAYANLFAQMGYSFGDIVPELEMVWRELSPGGARAYALAPLLGTTTPEEAAEIFCRKFEGYNKDSGIQKRKGYARSFFNSMADIAAGNGAAANIGGETDEDALTQYETPIINQRKYATSKPSQPTGGHGPSRTAPIKTQVKAPKLPTGGTRQLTAGGSGDGTFDDSMILKLMTDMLNALNAINSTETKQLNAITGLLDSNGNPINIMNVQGGDTKVTNVTPVNGRRGAASRSTSVTHQETRARQIAGL